MEQKKYFKSKEEFFDCVRVVRKLRSSGIMAAWIHGSTVKEKGPDHRDIDIYAQRDNHLPGIDALAYRQNHVVGDNSGTTFDTISSIFPIMYTSLDHEDTKAAKLVFNRKKIPPHSRLINSKDFPRLSVFFKT